MRSIVFATALTAGVLNPYAPLTIDLAKLNTHLVKFSATSVALITRALTPAKPEAAPIDAVASAKIDEDLDYHIALQTRSIDGWRAFLAAHPNGAHALAARAELAEREPPPPPSDATQHAPAAPAGLDEREPPSPPSDATQHAPAAAAELDKREPPPPDARPQAATAPAASFALAVEVANAPARQPDFFRSLEQAAASPPPAKTIIKWRERRVVRWRAERPRYRPQPSGLPSFLAALFGDQRSRAAR